MLKFAHRGTEYVYNEMKMSAAEAMAVKKRTGLGMLNLMQGVAEGDPNALVALVMLAQLRAGELKHIDIAGPNGDKVWQELCDSFDDEHGLMDMVQTFEFLTDAQIVQLEKFAADLAAADPAEAVKTPAKRTSK